MVFTATTHFDGAAQLIEQHALFSANEELDDILTESLKYVMTPFYLAELQLKVVDSERVGHLASALRYYSQFLATCKRLKLARKEDLKSLKRDAPIDPTSRRAELIGRVKR
jgi:hypothetical protein